MAVAGLCLVSSSRRIIGSYRLPLTLQLRYLTGRLTSICVTNCRLVSLGQRRLAHLPCCAFVRWNSSSSASSGVENADVSHLAEYGSIRNLQLLMHINAKTFYNKG